MRLRWALAGCLFAAAAAVPQPAAAQRAPDAIDTLVNLPVRSISFVIEGEPDTSPGLFATVDVKKDAPLQLEDVHTSIHHLYSAGYVAEVFGTPNGNGVDITFDLIPFHPVTGFRFDGATGLSPQELDKRARDHFGAALATATPEAAAAFVAETLKSEGYLRAAPTASRLLQHAPHQTTIVVDVNAGAQAHVGEVGVEGHLGPLSKDDVIKLTHTARGEAYRPQSIEAGLSSVRDKLRAQKRYTATAEWAASHESPDGTVVDVTLHVEAGPEVQVRYDGPTPPGNLKELVPIERESSADKDLLDDSSGSLESSWRMQGYKEAHVDHTSVPNGDGLTVTFTIHRGDRYVLRDIHVAGNQAFTAPDLETSLGLKRGNPFVEAEVNVAQERLKQKYLAAGFYNVDIKHTDENHGMIGGAVSEAVRFDIVEGPKATVTDISFRRSTSGISDKDLSEAMLSKKDKPYVAQNVRSDEERLITAYADRGFPNAVAHITTGGSDTAKTLTVDITEGVQVIVGDIRVVGYRRTKEQDILHALTLKVGQPLGDAARHESELRVIRMGLFKNVHVAAEPLAAGETRAHVVVTVEEAPATVLGYGGGVEAGQRTRTTDTGAVENFSYVAPRGFFEITRQNFGGVNRALDWFSSVSLSPSTSGSGYGFTEYRVALNYTDRLIFNSNNDLTGTASSEQAIRTEFEFIRQALGIKLLNRISPRLRIQEGYTLEFTKLFNQQIPLDDRLEVDREFAQVRLSKPAVSILWDRRNDPVAPTTGSLLSADTELAARNIGSEVGFVKTLLQGSVFHSLTPSKGVVAAARLQVGLAHGYPYTDPTTGDVITDLPASERFFAGGGNTVRGFALDALGVPAIIHSDGLSNGGSGLVVINTELRMRVAKIFRRD